MAKLTVAVAAAGLAGVLLLGGMAAAVGGASGAAGLSPAAGIPAELAGSIQRAAGAFCNLPPPLLAAVLKVESGFDNAAVNPRSGAFTMAQFTPPTWTQWAVNGNPDQDATVDPGDPADVTASAARYLCALGAGNPDTQRLAVAAYNAGPHAVRRAGGIPHRAQCPPSHPPGLDRRCETADYVRKVVAQAAAYAAQPTRELPAGGLLARVIGFAYAKVGTPYRWGGDGANGFYDCSGFTMRAYAQAGVRLPRASRQQYRASPHVDGDLQPGDLLFGPTTPATPAASTTSPSTSAAPPTASIGWSTRPTAAPPSKSAAPTGPASSARPAHWARRCQAGEPWCRLLFASFPWRPDTVNRAVTAASVGATTRRASPPRPG